MWGLMGAVQMLRSSRLLAETERFGSDYRFYDADPLPGDDTDMTYFIVADDAFALET